MIFVMTTIGTISLNISLILYCIYFVPQIIYNQVIKKTDQISLITQGLMVTANLCDLIYGFYLDMPWQYKMVTILTLSFLLIQHIQIGIQSVKNKKFIILSFVLVILAFYVLNSIIEKNINHHYIDLFGMVTNIIYWIHWIPQIFFNWQHKKAEGFSFIFLLLTLFASICDEISALALGWDYPSIIGPLVLILMISMILTQRLIYAKKPLKFKMIF